MIKLFATFFKALGIGTTFLAGVFSISLSANADSRKDSAKAEAWKCFSDSADYFVKNTSEAADVLAPAVIKRCQSEVVKWQHLLALEINHSQNLMIATSIAQTEAQVTEQFARSLPAEVSILVVEARARLNSSKASGSDIQQ